MEGFKFVEERLIFEHVITSGRMVHVGVQTEYSKD